MKTLLANLFLVGFVCMAGIGCDPLPCVNKPVATVQISLVRDSSGTELPGKLYYRKVYLLYDSTLLLLSKTRRDSVSAFSLPASPLRPDMALVVEDSLSKDTLRIAYQARHVFVSEECGFMNFYTLTSAQIAGPHFKAVSILEPIVDSTRKTHVTIFL